MEVERIMILVNAIHFIGQAKIRESSNGIAFILVKKVVIKIHV